MIVFENGRLVFHARNTYWNSDLSLLQIPSDHPNELPIFILHLQTDNVRQFAFQSIFRVIDVAPGAEVSIIESYHGVGHVAYLNRVVNVIHVRANAQVNWYRWQQEGTLAIHHSDLFARLEQKSTLSTYEFIQGAQHSRHYLNYDLLGESATCESLGYYHSTKQQYFLINSRIQHSASQTNSRQLYKGLVEDESEVVFSGRVSVDKNLKAISAYQANNNLLLSSQAKVETHPELEIYSDDVQCSHGATVGQLDEEAVFYLRSRGLSESSARLLLTDSFVEEVLQAFPQPEIARWFQGAE